MQLLSWTFIALIVVGLLYGGLVTYGAWRWDAATGGLLARLDAADVTETTARYDAGSLTGLPAPVRRYFERALTDGQPMVRRADIAMRGTFNLSLKTPQWKPFTSVQQVVTNRPGFVWNATIRLFPVFPVRVHDAYVAGTGILRPAILGLFPMGEVQGTGETARGELMRWLAEGVWYPTVLLPGQDVEWQPVDDASAQVTLTDGAIQLTMLFRFGEDGLVSGIHADARGGLIGGKTVMMPWEGKFSDYRLQDGMMIPFFGEVAWIMPQGEMPYFRATVTQMTYRFAE
ncbi:MAG: DUF6544 family protein [Cypionkella sp.]